MSGSTNRAASAGDAGCHGYLVTCFEAFDPFADLDDFANKLVPQYLRWMDTGITKKISLQVRSANRTRFHFDQQPSRLDLRVRDIFNANVMRPVKDNRFHFPILCSCNAWEAYIYRR